MNFTGANSFWTAENCVQSDACSGLQKTIKMEGKGDYKVGLNSNFPGLPCVAGGCVYFSRSGKSF